MNKICIVTATRAEYGVIRNLIKKIDHDPELQLCLLVTGTHLSQTYGNTKQEILDDGIAITQEIPILDQSVGELGVLRTMGNAMYAFAEAFKKHHPDMLLVVGDRYELLPICEAAMIWKIPITHVSGGELTEGIIDDVVRHCVTKMSLLHFPACETYRKRIIQLGEQPERVFNYGDIGVENLITMEYMNREELEKSINFELKTPYACVTFHPVTLEKQSPEKQIQELLNAIEQFSNLNFVFTGSNADAGGEVINERIYEYVEHHSNCVFYHSLGIKRYLSLLKYSEMIIGNSSSGIIEAPSLKIPTVNIGNRQGGRLKADSVIDCRCTCKEIKIAIDNAMTEEFKRKALKTINPYGNGKTSDGIIKEIKKFLANNHGVVKKFYDVEFHI